LIGKPSLKSLVLCFAIQQDRQSSIRPARNALSSGIRPYFLSGPHPRMGSLNRPIGSIEPTILIGSNPTGPTMLPTILEQYACVWRAMGLFSGCFGSAWVGVSSFGLNSQVARRSYVAGYELDVTLILLSLVLALLGSGALSIDHLLGI
jgi:hypothetical protein